VRFFPTLLLLCRHYGLGFSSFLPKSPGLEIEGVGLGELSMSFPFGFVQGDLVASLQDQVEYLRGQLDSEREASGTPAIGGRAVRRKGPAPRNREKAILRLVGPGGIG
jgi:hypothetical protein